MKTQTTITSIIESIKKRTPPTQLIRQKKERNKVKFGTTTIYNFQFISFSELLRLTVHNVTCFKINFYVRSC